MLDPLTALGLAANVIQISDFVRRTLNDAHEIYSATSGTLVRNNELNSVTLRLKELTAELTRQLPAKQEDGTWTKQKCYDNELNSVDLQLLELIEKTEQISLKIQELLQKLASADSSKWKSVRKAVESAWRKNELLELEGSLEKVRQELDTNLLVSMRSVFAVLQQKSDDQAKETNKVLEILLKRSQESPAYTDGLSPQDPDSSAVTMTDLLLETQMRDGEERLRNRDAKTIIQLLRFDALPERFEAIARAHRQTFEWIFNDDTQEVDRSHCHSFTDWLRSDEKIYWVSGKPGAGKSTLMKFLLLDSQTQEHAKAWAATVSPQRPQFRLIAFFFWLAGSALQKSKEGMLRSLLFQMTDCSSELVPLLFRDRMRRYEVLGRDMTPLSSHELINAVKALVTHLNMPFLIFIDGLDEFDGSSDAIIADINSLASHPLLKLCIASRPWPSFVEAYEDCPNLRIEYLTMNDISKFVNDGFAESKTFVRLQSTQEMEANALKAEIVRKAQGVFLWVYVVVKTLKIRLRDGEGISEVSRRLAELPDELEGLFDRIFQNLDPDYTAQASEIFQLFRGYKDEMTLLALQFSFTPVETALMHNYAPLTDEAANSLGESMQQKLFSRCKCFLEVSEPFNAFSKIRYLHRTARDYIVQDNVWSEILKHQPRYDKAEAISISRLMLAKAYYPKVLSLRPDAVATRYGPIAKLAFLEDLGNIQNLLLRYQFLDAVDWLGQKDFDPIEWKRQKGFRPIEEKSWFDYVALNQSKVFNSIWAPDPPPVCRIKDKLDLAICMDYVWYLDAELPKRPAFPTLVFGNLPLLSFAAKFRRYNVQSILLEAGADPNQTKDFALTPWERFLGGLEFSERLSTSLQIRLMALYLEHGASTGKIRLQRENGGDESIRSAWTLIERHIADLERAHSSPGLVIRLKDAAVKARGLAKEREKKFSGLRGTLRGLASKMKG